MSAVVMLAPKPGTKGATRVFLAQRSRREPNTLLIVKTTKLMARGGTIEKLPLKLFDLISTLAEAGGSALHRDLVESLWGETEDGGPTHAAKIIDVLPSRYHDALDALGIKIKATYQHGDQRERVLVLVPISGRQVSSDVTFRVGDPSGAHWVPRARAMRERGASYRAIGDAVGRHETTVRRALLGLRTTTRGNRTAPSPEALQRNRDRNEARREAKRTGEPVEQIYARWGCETVDRSRLWDQRRAAAQASEARP